MSKKIILSVREVIEGNMKYNYLIYREKLIAYDYNLLNI